MAGAGLLFLEKFSAPLGSEPLDLHSQTHAETATGFGLSWYVKLRVAQVGSSFGWTGESSDVAALVLVLSIDIKSYCGERGQGEVSTL